MVELYWATRREQLAEQRLQQKPDTTLPTINTAIWWENRILSQARIAGKPENIIVFLGPIFSPKYPPARHPNTWPILRLLAEKINNYLL